MAHDVILALDQGSSSTRCVAYDGGLRELGSAARSLATSRPAAGFVEHDPEELLRGALETISEVERQLRGTVVALGIASQTESFVVWERETGRAVSPVVSWQDQRAGALCAEIAKRPGAARIQASTGLPLEATFSAPKLAWLFERDPLLHARAGSGELLFGDVASWLAWHLSAGEGHVTEPSNACRSLLLDLDRLRWDEGLLELFGVPESMLPEVRPSDDPAVSVRAGVAGFEAPIAALLGDQPAALYGHGCTSPGQSALTLGTGAFVWLNAGPTRPPAPPGVLATVAWSRRASGSTYALEAFSANAGNALDVLGGIGFRTAEGPIDWTRALPVVIPAPAGLGTPHWAGGDRISVLQATSTTTAEDLAAAAVAGVAHQIVDALEALGAEALARPPRVGGGLSAHEGLVQSVADLSGRTLEIAADPEATARGVAALAGDAVGTLDDDAGAPSVARRVEPRLDDIGRERERARWSEALAAHLGASV